jgi:hypothetical protein
MREYRHGVMHAAERGVPIIRVVDLGNAPSHIVEPHGQVFKYEGNAADLAAKILAVARRH